MDVKAWLALGIFVFTIFSIARGWLKASTAALIGASLMMFLKLVPGVAASQYVDSNTVGLLVGMMIVVGILSKTGLFQYIAIKAIKVTGGRGILILLSISFVTALLSAFLDNVTTVLLVSPVVISLSDLIKMNPLPLLLTEVIASNIGGTATLIGDPPNMIIGSYAHFSFNDFLFHIAPIVVLIWAIVMVFLCLYYKKDLVSDSDATKRLDDVDESKLIKDKRLMIKSGLVMTLVLIGFFFHHHIGINASVIALVAAGSLLAIAKLNDTEILHNEVEWPTIVYFVSLFILVGGLQENGIIMYLASFLSGVLSGSPMLMILGVLWISGICCIFINNVAFAAMFVHVVGEMAQAGGVAPEPLFWALALGSCLGGNGSYLGAAANAVLADCAARNGFEISFKSFMSIGVKVVLISLVISSMFLYLVYGVFGG